MTHSGADQALQRLKLFNEKAEEIRDSQFVKQVFRPGHGFTWLTPGDGSMKTEWRGADREATKAFALDLRYFIWSQPKDKINLKQVRELYETLPASSVDKQTIRDLADSLDRALDSTAVVIKAEPITWRRLLEVFMYGGLAHFTQRAVYKEWTEKESVAVFMRHNFEKIAKAMVYVICQVRHVNERVIAALEYPALP
jgi:hypothetical protein